MQNVTLLPLTDDTTTVQAIFERLDALEDCTVQIIKAQHRFSAGEVVLVIIGADWQAILDANPGYIDTLAASLSRSDLLVLNLMLGDAAFPSVTTLPDQLHALPYLSAIHIESPETLQRDMRQVITQIATYFREQTVGGIHSPQNRPKKAGTLPANLILILLVLFFAIMLLLITRIRRSSEAEQTASSSTEIVTVDQIIIGIAAGFSEGAAERGFEIVNGVELALRARPSVTINNQTYPIDLITQDTLCSASGSISAAGFFAADSTVTAIIGHQCDTGCSAAAPIYDAADLTMISPSCSLSRLANHDSFLRTLPTDDYAAALAANLVRDVLTINNVTVIHDEIILGGEMARLFRATFEENGRQIAGFHAIETTSADFTELAETISSADTQLIYYAGRPSNAAQLRSLLPDIPFMLADSNGVETYITQAGNLANGTYVVTLNPPQTEKLITLRDEYTSVFGETPKTATFAYAYDATNLLLDSIEATFQLDDENQIILNREALRDTMRAYDGTGATGRLNCGNTSSCASGSATLWMIREGELTEVNWDD